MNKIIRRFIALGTAVVMATGLTACKEQSDNEQIETGGTKKQQSEDKITVMADDSMFTDAEGANEFYDYYKKLTGLNIEWKRYSHNEYKQAVAEAFRSDDTMPDVVLLSSEEYSEYASKGYLWNMTDAWEKSQTKKSNRLSSDADNVLSALKVNGSDGRKGMYGFSPTRGNGYCTYIKQSWLTDAGINPVELQRGPVSFETYYEYLKKMAKAKGQPVISVPGFISEQAPYTNCLAEFYQQAHYSFYKNTAGEYVDGFSEKAMCDALLRIQKAVKDGVIAKETDGNPADAAYASFCSPDESVQTGVLSYWAGSSIDRLKFDLKSSGQDDSLIAINPVNELGAYTERIAPCWCITTAAKDPEGIFNSFIDTMLDGKDIQTAWTYGAKGTHWDTKAETLTLPEYPNEYKTYSEGRFHLLPGINTEGYVNRKNLIEPLMSLATYEKTDSNPNGDDPGKFFISDASKKSQAFFDENSNFEEPLPVTMQLSEHIQNINETRNYVISQVAIGKMSVDKGMEYYNSKTQTSVDIILKSLNNN